MFFLSYSCYQLKIVSLEKSIILKKKIKQKKKDKKSTSIKNKLCARILSKSFEFSLVLSWLALRDVFQVCDRICKNDI